MQTLKSTGLVLDVRAAPGDTFVDISRYHAAITNNNVITAKGLGNSLAGAYNGSTAYLDCGNDASLNITDAITIEAWVKFEDFSTNPCIIQRKVGSYENYWMDIRTNGTSWLHGSYTSTGGNCYDETAYTFETGKWYHLVWTYNKVRSIAYINGEEKSNVSKTCTPNSGTGVLYIGARNKAFQFFNGTIDEVRIYNYALSAYEITDHYYEYASYLGVG